MKARLCDNINRPAIAVIGNWDPLVPAHQELFKHLSYYARQVSLASLVIMLHPPPQSFIPENPLEWPIYDDPKTRISLIRACGIDATLLIQFEKHDLDAPATEFFDIVCREVTLDELLIGAHQTLGRGPEASDEVVMGLARRHKIRLHRLPPMSEDYLVTRAREFLRRGSLTDAIKIVGRPPVWNQPSQGRLRLPWPSGSYFAVPLVGPTASPKQSPIKVHLVTERDGFPSIIWPSRKIKWLAFTAGPANPQYS